MGQNNSSGTHGIAGLKKHDVTTAGIVFMLYCLVGAGAFGIEAMIPKSGPGLTLLMLTIFPIIWAYPISNLVAECGALLPSEGGVYVWVKEAYGEFWGFNAGWWATVSTYVTNGTYVALVASYVSQVIPMSEAATVVIKVGMILIFTVINLMGLKEVEKISTILSVLILLAFALIAVVGLVNWKTNPVQPFVPEGQGIIDSIGEGISICIWMYCGYECISNMAGEVKKPQRIPKGLMIAMPLVALTYILPTLGGLASLPAGSWQNWSLAQDMGVDKVGYSSILTTYLGDAWGYIFLVIAIISQCAIFNTYLTAGSRGFFVLADDRLSPKIITRVSKKKGVPYIGILSLAVVTLILSRFDFSTLVNTEVVFMLSMYILLALSVVKLRKKYPVEERKKQGIYVMPGGRAGLGIFVALPVIVAVIALVVNGTDYFFVGILAISTGPVAYIIFKLIYGGLYKIDPLKYPINRKTRLAFGDTVRIGVYMLITGMFSFAAELWLHWYEVTNGEWTPDDYAMFSNSIPQIMNILKWGGLILAALGIIMIFIGKSIEKDTNKLS